MGELKNLELIKDTASKLLGKTCKIVFDYPRGWMQIDIIPSAISVGKRWPERERLIGWIQKLAKRDRLQDWLWWEWYYFGHNTPGIGIGEFIGSIGMDNKKIKGSVTVFAETLNLHFSPSL